MRISTTMTGGAGVLLALLLTGTLAAQDRAKAPARGKDRGVRPASGERVIDRPGTVREMEIYDGARRTVRYFGENLSPSETTMLKEMERLENEGAYTREVLALKRQYVYGERLMEPYRRLVQKNLYGRQTTRSFAGGFGAVAAYGYPYSYGNVFARVPGYGGYLPYGYGYGGLVGGYLSEASTETRSLAYGVGDEGPIKEAMASQIATQATPEYATSVGQAYDRVVLRASATPRLSVAMNLPRTGELRKFNDGIRQAEGEATSGVVLTLKGGEKIRGKTMKDGKEWITVELADGSMTRVRPGEVVRIDAAPGIRFAAD